MHSKVFLITVYFCVITSSQQSESSAQCQCPPNFHCNCGALTQDDNRSDQSSNIQQGRPGRIGPVGSVGPKGQKVRVL